METQTSVGKEEMVSQFSGKQYMCIESYRRNGLPVQTPVWFVGVGGLLYFHTDHRTGKVKRIQRNSRVRVVPCSARGKPQGTWVEGDARFVEGPEAAKVKSMIDKKYGWPGRIGRLYQWLTRRREIALVISIRSPLQTKPAVVVYGEDR